MQFLSTSRPRFWLYLLGPFLIGLAAGEARFTWTLLIMGVYFTFPANLLVYGVNDIFDYETDKHNPKKQKYESLVTPALQQRLARVIFLTNAPMVVLMPWLNDPSRWALAGFVFFGVFYSAPPIRAKTKPLLDSVFNMLYVFPGLVSFGLATASLPSLQMFSAATFWCMAMHAYSAVPDITADKKAGLRTIATWLGARGTLLFCLACYVLAAVLSWRYLGWFSIFGAAAYGGMMVWSLLNTARRHIFALYQYFPIINMLVGAGLFLWVLFIAK
jgi:lycopene elongase/hydratase (dihydrobisanhydrobacterioruberin-forming)